MLQFLQTLISRRDDERGASAVEYGLLVAAIAAIIVAVVFALGGLIDSAFTKTCEEIETGSSVAADC